jgi:hypothetical protein
MREAVGKYRRLIIARINPFIRRIEFEGLAPRPVAAKLVDDYNARNFVTAGGWAIEALAVRLNPAFQKSAAAGIDIQRFDAATGDYHLYVLKSGLVTRNSDIVGALKRNARAAERLLRQSQGTREVRLNYAIAAGRTRSTFEDGVRRPSSAEFWSEITGLPEDEALELVLAIAAEAGPLVRRDASKHVAAMTLLVEDYISDRKNPDAVDWEFIAKRNMRSPATWRDEDRERNRYALEQLRRSGYEAAESVSAAAEGDQAGEAETADAGGVAEALK